MGQRLGCMLGFPVVWQELLFLDGWCWPLGWASSIMRLQITRVGVVITAVDIMPSDLVVVRMGWVRMGLVLKHMQRCC